ncbi:DUF7922 domain-containing protein [Anaeromicrobium sediminis]|uniref:DUF7922 domain-containing protein n=1 Tax=Anaeromicrobium sediminis TaxID=1478221 RepID=A0A267MGM2_9FIRM|nr:hypothetical protein [Anaeromicrobium sediminis]PAB58058.1 hypothetical protein CCE28_17125 [Anaeromicrobium sediminis]
MDNKKYRRYFIILGQEDEGFSLQTGKSPKGYTKIEVKNGKGVLTHYIQNIKYFYDAEYVYRSYLVGTNRDDIIYMDNGILKVEESGKAELKWTFNADNVDGKKASMKDFNVVCIVAESTKDAKRKSIIIPLAGYIDKKKVVWKEAFSSKLYKKNKEDLFQKHNEKEEIHVSHEHNNDYEVAENKIENLVDVESDKNTYEEEREVADSISPVEDVPVEFAEVSKEDNILEEVLDKNNEEEKVELFAEVKEDEEIEAFKNLGTEVEVQEEIEAFKDIETEVEAEEEIETFKNLGTEVEVEEEIETFKNLGTEVDVQEEIEAFKDIETEVEVKEELNTFKDSGTEVEKEFIEYDKKNLDFMGNQFGYMEEEIESSHKEFQLDGLTNRDSMEHSSYQYHFKMICKYVESMLGYYPEIIPFDKNIQNTRWWRIDYDDQTMYRNFLPFYGYVSEEDNEESGPTCPGLINKYEHYIFGIKYEEDDTKYYMYGIPGRFMESEQPYEGMTGFVYWHPVEAFRKEVNDYGYWILHIDAKTGKIVVPKDPTLPPRI